MGSRLPMHDNGRTARIEREYIRKGRIRRKRTAFFHRNHLAGIALSPGAEAGAAGDTVRSLPGRKRRHTPDGRKAGCLLFDKRTPEFPKAAGRPYCLREFSGGRRHGLRRRGSFRNHSDAHRKFAAMAGKRNERRPVGRPLVHYEAVGEPAAGRSPKRNHSPTENL